MDISTFTHALQQGANGIWFAPAGGAVSYPDGGHAACRQVEDGSFWFRHRNRCIVAAVNRHRPSGPIFDIGGGNGFVSLGLAQAGHEMVLVEPGPEGAANARARGLPHVVCSTLQHAGFASDSLPAIGIFDVIEHIEDDRAFARLLASLLRPGGWLYATVPAHALLWSQEDVSAGHFRRYGRAGLCEVVQSAGLQVQYCTMFFSALRWPILLLRALPYRLGLRRGPSSADVAAREHGADGGASVSLVERLLAAEYEAIADGRELRKGASILLVARKLA